MLGRWVWVEEHTWTPALELSATMQCDCGPILRLPLGAYKKRATHAAAAAVLAQRTLIVVCVLLRLQL
jgi:hypothetical protein